MTLVQYVLLHGLFLFGYWFYVQDDRIERIVFVAPFFLMAIRGSVLGMSIVVGLLFAIEVIGRHWWADHV